MTDYTPRYNAVPVDCISRVLVETLCLFHMLFSCTSLLSATLTLILRCWALTGPWCVIQGLVSYVAVLTVLYVVVLVSCYRVAGLRNPLASPGRMVRLSRWNFGNI